MNCANVHFPRRQSSTNSMYSSYPALQPAPAVTPLVTSATTKYGLKSQHVISVSYSWAFSISVSCLNDTGSDKIRWDKHGKVGGDHQQHAFNSNNKIKLYKNSRKQMVERILRWLCSFFGSSSFVAFAFFPFFY